KGTVASSAEKNKVTEMARSVAGVRDVANGLKIDAAEAKGSAAPRRPAGTPEKRPAPPRGRSTKVTRLGVDSGGAGSRDPAPSESRWHGRSKDVILIRQGEVLTSDRLRSPLRASLAPTSPAPSPHRC